MDKIDMMGFRFFGLQEPKPPRKLDPGMVRIDEPKPMSHYCHYSNPDSQGSLICETKGFPAGYFTATEDYHCAYSDRMYSWDSERMKRACALAGGGDQVWSTRLPCLSDDALKAFAQEAFGLASVPKHVRVIHYYNVSNGYSCPVVIAICEKVPA